MRILAGERLSCVNMSNATYARQPSPSALYNFLWSFYINVLCGGLMPSGAEVDHPQFIQKKGKHERKGEGS